MAMQFTDDNFAEEVEKSELPVLVDFYAEWCGPCKMMGPIIDELAKEFDGKWKIGKVDVDANPELSGKYGVQSIPTLVFFKDGQEVDKMMGFKSKEELMKKLEE